MGHGMVRIQLDRPGEMDGGLVEIAGPRQHDAEIVVGEGRATGGGDGLAVFADRLLGKSGLGASNPAVEVPLRPARLVPHQR